MDYYNFDSEVIESLNFLRPPVKRASGNANRDFSVYCSANKNNIKVLKEFGHKFKSKCTIKNDIQPRPTKHGDSSTSLILKRTSESQILKQYSVVYTGLHCQEQTAYTQPKTPITPINQDKPLIKVTVIPKSEQNAGSKLFRKQRIVTKTLQATSSNHENSIHTKNVYLVVAGRKKDKIYEIKTTGSVNFEKENIKDESLEHLSHFKEFIKTLNMERKRKKNKKRDSKRNETQVNICETMRNIDHECKCSPAVSEESVNDVRPGRSRVRIFGRIGLTTDDKYVVKCQATVDDKPVLQSALKKKPSVCSSAVCSKNVETSTYRRTNRPLYGREGEEFENDTREEPMRFQRTSVPIYGREEFDNSREERWRTNDAPRMREEIEPEEKQMLWRNTGVLCLRGDSDQDIRDQPTETNDVCEEESEDDIIEEPARDLRHVLMQTEVRRSNALNELLINIQKKNSTKICNQSQATQVNFNKTDDLCKTQQQVVRCNCSSQGGPVIETIDNSQHCLETLKPCQSPLVIISVYPKQGPNKPDLVQTIQCAHIKNKPLMYPETTAESMAEVTINKTTDIDPWFRPSSPKGTKIKSKVNKYVETRQTKSRSRNEIPKGKKYARKGSSPPKQQEFLSSKPGESEKKRKSSPPRSPRAKSPSPSNREQINRNASKQGLKGESKKSKKVDAGMNTEHQKTKKALVDSYTTKISEHMKVNKEGPMKSLSTVSINIDSEHEYYDVTFRQNNLATDLNLRGTMKETCVQNVFEEDAESLKNFPPRMSKNQKNGKHKKSFVENQTDGLKKSTPKLAVRDSLEINHRREGKVIRDTQTRRSVKQPALETNFREFLAPIKHFTGDNCTICDPVERDREIRELLGVDERRNNSHFNVSKDQVVAFENILSRRCFYNKQCEKSYVTGFALSQPHTPCICNDDNEREESDFKLDHGDNSVSEEEQALPGKKSTEQKDTVNQVDDDSLFYPGQKKNTKTEQFKEQVNADIKTKNVSCECILESDDSCPCLIPPNPNDKCPYCGKPDTLKIITESAESINKNKQNILDEPKTINVDKVVTESLMFFNKHKQNYQDEPKTTKAEKGLKDFFHNINKSKKNDGNASKATKVDKEVTRCSPSVCKNKPNDEDEPKTTKVDKEVTHCSPSVCKNKPNDEDEPKTTKVDKEVTQCSYDFCKNKQNDKVERKTTKIDSEVREYSHSFNNHRTTDRHETKTTKADKGLTEFPHSFNKHKQNDQDKPRTTKEDKGVTDCLHDININKKSDQDEPKKNKVYNRVTEISKNTNKSKQYNQVERKPIKSDVVRENTSDSKPGDLSDSNVASLYQQLTLNRNIQIFLQVEQFSKQKPIVLSKKQYNKIKKTIQRTILAREKSKRCVCNLSAISVSPKNEEMDQAHSNKSSKSAKSKKSQKSKKFSKKEDEKHDTVVLFSNETRGSLNDKTPLKFIVNRADSSLEIRNSSISYWKHITFSSTNVGSIGSSSIANRNQHSLETIFRGHRKSLTPNLGTSAFSLLTEARISESQSMKISPDPKAKKPFLKRLMSCLVLRTRVSERIPSPVAYPRSINSSVDSYHIGTSLGAIEMTSSIYDTSVSFYSDHSIHPLSSKFKRSFLSSVKGFLTSRKS